MKGVILTGRVVLQVISSYFLQVISRYLCSAERVFPFVEALMRALTLAGHSSPANYRNLVLRS